MENPTPNPETKAASSLKPIWEFAFKTFSFIFAIMTGVTTIFQFWQLFEGNQDETIWKTAGLALLVFIISLFYIGWIYDRSPNQSVQVFNWIQKSARALFILSLILGIGSGVYISNRNEERNQKFVVLVLDFYGPEPENYQVRQTLANQIEDALSPFSSESEVVETAIQIEEGEGKTEAVELGKKYQADLVLWGRYQVINSSVRVTVHVANLAELSRKTLPDEDYTDATPSDDLTFVDKLSGQSRAMALFISGMTRYEIDDYAEAEKRIGMAIEQGEWPDQLESKAVLYFYRGYARLKLKRYEDSIKDFDHVIELLEAQESEKTPRRLSKTLNNRGQVYKSLGQVDDAISDFKNAILVDSTYLNPYFSLGITYGDIEKYDLARETFQKILNMNPDNVGAYNNIGVTYNRQNDYTTAIEYFKNALKINPNYYLSYCNRGFSYEKQEQLEPAFQDYMRCMSLNPEYPKAYSGLGYIYALQKNYESSIENFSVAISLDPTYSIAFYNRGLSYKNLGMIDPAISDFKNAIRLDANYLNAHMSLGNIYGDNLKEYDLARTEYRKVIEIEPNNAFAYNNIGATYKNQKDYATAIQYFEKALNIDPNYYLACYNMGYSYEMLHKYDLAVKEYLRCISLQPENFKAYNSLGWVYTQLDQFDLAIQTLSKAIELNPASSNTYLNRGNAYKNLAQYELARDDFIRAIELNPKNAWAYYFLGYTYEKLNEPSFAIDYLEMAIQLSPDDPILAKYANEELKKLQP